LEKNQAFIWFMEVENDAQPVAASKNAYKYKTEDLYRSIHGTNQLNGSWKKKFASRMNALSSQDRFQKLSLNRRTISTVFCTQLINTHPLGE
jgi:hypothetical protein